MGLEIIQDFSFVIEPRKVLSRIGDKRPWNKIDAGLASEATKEVIWHVEETIVEKSLRMKSPDL